MNLYDYQIDAIDRLSTGSILYGGVGSGKSRTSLAYFYTKVCGGELSLNGKGKSVIPSKPRPLYIITTARKREDLSWEKECSVFGLSSDKTKSVLSIDVVIDSWNCIKKYKDVTDAFFIFDEQRVVGSGAWVKAFLKIAKSNDWIILSATPGDTWTDYIPVFIANGFYKNRTDFVRQHVVYSRYTKYPKVDRYLNTGRLIREQREVLVPMYYEKKNTQHSIKVNVPYDKQLYSDTQKIKWNIYEDRPCQNAAEFCFVLRRIVNESHYRIDAMTELLQSNDRLVIFYNFNYELDLLKKICDSLGVEYGQWNGHQHDLIPNTDRWAYLVQYTAGAEGWNCIETNAMVFYSLNYSYKATKQAAGRIDRLNSPYSDLYYYYLETNSPIDKAIGMSLHKKKNFNYVKFTSKFTDQFDKKDTNKQNVIQQPEKRENGEKKDQVE